MRLNLDCVRSILLCVEENTGLRKACVFVDPALEEAERFVGNAVELKDYQRELLEDYSSDELIYHINYCVKADLLEQLSRSTEYRTVITDLTPKGHDFLNNIRDNKIWSGVKSIAAKIGSKSLNAAVQIASNVITELIKAQFSITGTSSLPM